MILLSNALQSILQIVTLALIATSVLATHSKRSERSDILARTFYLPDGTSPPHYEDPLYPPWCLKLAEYIQSKSPEMAEIYRAQAQEWYNKHPPKPKGPRAMPSSGSRARSSSQRRDVDEMYSGRRRRSLDRILVRDIKAAIDDLD